MATRKIVIAIDPLSKEAHKTIEWSMENFLKFDDHIELTMILVFDSEFTESELGMGAIDNLLLIEEETIKNRIEDLAKVATHMKTKGFINVTTHVFKTGPSKACRTLVDFVDSSKVDCLVMGSRNLAGWKTFFMGSFSDYVQSRIHCPVLIVR